MNNYVAIGVSAENILREQAGPRASWSFDGLFDFIDRIGVETSNALTDPRVQEFMREVGIKVEEARIEQKNRETAKAAKNNLIKWGAVAVTVVLVALGARKRK